MEFSSVNLNAWKTKLDKGNYTLLGIYPNLSEEVAAKIVRLSKWKVGKYLNYIAPLGEIDMEFDTALESLSTLMQANGLYLENPYSKEPPCKPEIKDYEDGWNYDIDIEGYKLALNQWQQAQSCTSECWAVLKVNK